MMNHRVLLIPSHSVRRRSTFYRATHRERRCCGTYARRKHSRTGRLVCLSVFGVCCSLNYLHFQESSSSVLSVAFNGDDTLAAAGTASGEVRVWDIPSSSAVPPVNLLFKPSDKVVVSLCVSSIMLRASDHCNSPLFDVHCWVVRLTTVLCVSMMCQAANCGCLFWVHTVLQPVVLLSLQRIKC